MSTKPAPLAQKGKKVVQDVRERRFELCRDGDERNEEGVVKMNSFRSTEFFANLICALLSINIIPILHRSEVAPGLRKGSRRITKPRSLFVKGPLPAF